MRNIETSSILEPKELWEYFNKILEIPHGSGNEAALSNFIYEIGIKLGLSTYTDKHGNVLIKKIATSGRENSTKILLQCHMDMVCQKDDNVKHDFLKDPIKAFVENGFLKTEGTTLGADNGIGLCAILAILESKTIKHGPIEALFTVDEERGMTGIKAFEQSLLNSDLLINLDSGKEGFITIGCAGGIDTTITGFYDEKLLDQKDDFSPFRISISGLIGGHSGIDINKRGNANLILIEFLSELLKNVEFRISSINGGNLRNAIPRTSNALIIIEKKSLGIFYKHFEEIKKVLQFNYQLKEPKLLIYYEEDNSNRVMDISIQSKLLTSILESPSGVYKISSKMEDYVSSSTNLAILEINNGKIVIDYLSRSCYENEKKELSNEIERTYKKYGLSVKHHNAYSGWLLEQDSLVVIQLKEVSRKLFETELKVRASQGGLECGLLIEKYPNLQAVALGPTIIDNHSPSERVNIKSVTWFWDFLVGILLFSKVKCNSL